MKLDNIAEVIATRTLKLVGDDAAASEVLVLVGKPQRLPDHTDYYCPYQIKGVGPDKLGYVCGIDPMQALLLTLSTLGVEVEILNKKMGGRLRWDCDDSGGFGFPPVSPGSL
ncbi:MAG: hypothetical protein WA002_16360 [Candidatus Acidiferrales bacterium]